MFEFVKDIIRLVGSLSILFIIIKFMKDDMSLLYRKDIRKLSSFEAIEIALFSAVVIFLLSNPVIIIVRWLQ